ncbi:MAG: hypothetical protein ACU0CY_11450 [Maritimibacter harenae]|jgi:uncharacterized protein YjiS (DUF1127 family)|uniref:DUF1127 domain-containing protein n=1 Tax=Maritimibacter harenae TaxID=2606218 RepID=A0A845M9A4_9RHOB|nr:hypothetical protein [Maritimibacter harenae]MZR13444.1 DUF1127 domain-containing protein [Maritimibacter harenae]
MAYTATNSDFAASHPIFARIADRLKAFGKAYVEARSRQAEIAALEAMTDDQLAERGLTRDGIVRHVFADTYYL